MTDATDKNTTPEPDADLAPSGRKQGLYAAYDKTYERFVGGVHRSAAAARKAAKDKGASDIAIREV